MFPDRTGVHDDHIRSLGFVGDGIAGLDKVAPKLLGIGFVLLAAIGFYIGFGGDVFFVPIGGDFITKGELLLQLRRINDGGFCVHGEFLRKILSQL